MDNQEEHSSEDEVVEEQTQELYIEEHSEEPEVEEPEVEEPEVEEPEVEEPEVEEPEVEEEVKPVVAPVKKIAPMKKPNLAPIPQPIPVEVSTPKVQPFPRKISPLVRNAIRAQLQETQQAPPSAPKVDPRKATVVSSSSVATTSSSKKNKVKTESFQCPGCYYCNWCGQALSDEFCKMNYN